MRIINWEQDPLYNTEQYQHKRAEFVSDRVSYTVLRGRWCNIVLNVHAPIEEKSDDSKVIFMRN
jgi:hypothetical protein